MDGAEDCDYYILTLTRIDTKVSSSTGQYRFLRDVKVPDHQVWGILALSGVVYTRGVLFFGDDVERRERVVCGTI